MLKTLVAPQLCCVKVSSVDNNISCYWVCSQGQPKWLQLLLSRNFGSIALVSAVMFMTQNGARAVLLPLLATQGFGLSAKLLGITSHACLADADAC